MKLTITIDGYQQGDLEVALLEIQNKISNGFTSGFDSNDTGSYNFDIEGESVEYWWIDRDRTVGDMVEPELSLYPETYYSLDEAQSSLDDEATGYGFKVYGLSYSNVVLVEVV
jgi:hypothetical protein